MVSNPRNLGPFWLWGILLALVLIGISTRSRLPPDNVALQQHFARQPTAALPLPGIQLPKLDIGHVPPEVRQAVESVQQQLGLGQSVPALTPVAQSPRVRVEIATLQQHADGLQIVGEVMNISSTEIDVPISAFELRDNLGATYVAGGGASVRLAPGERTPLDLTVPVPEGRGVLLTLTLPPDPPVTQVLLVSDE